MKLKKTFIILIILVIIGGLLRFVGNTVNPPELNIDEVAIGYNAYSLLKTGRDEYGVFMPLSFQSVGDYKPPVLIYLTVPSIAIFGLNEFAVRFPVAFISTLGIFVIYLLVKKLTDNKNYALVAAALYTISPWVIYFSRYAVEAMIATIFLMIGVLTTLHFFDHFKTKWGIVAGFFFILSMYTYHSNRLFVPLFLIAIVSIYRKVLFKNWRKLIIPLLISSMFIAPLLYTTLFGADATRAQSTFITKDIELQRTVLLSDKTIQNTALDLGLTIQHGIRKYLNYFTPDFFFFEGLGMTNQNTIGLGIVYLFELPFLLYGLILIFKNKVRQQLLIISWIILGIIPAALTQNEQHSLRTLLISPAIITLSAIGAYELYLLVKKYFLIHIIFTGFIIWNLVFAYSVFSVQFIKQKDENFMYGTKQAVQTILENKNNYQEIVFDPKRGREGPNVVSIPHMYILFYAQYDPHLYQTEQKRFGDDSFGFGKYTIRHIDWQKDRGKTNTLFAASPWSIPEVDVKPEVLKKKIYLHDGTLAILVVSSEN